MPVKRILHTFRYPGQNVRHCLGPQVLISDFYNLCRVVCCSIIRFHNPFLIHRNIVRGHQLSGKQVRSVNIAMGICIDYQAKSQHSRGPLRKNVVQFLTVVFFLFHGHIERNPCRETNDILLLEECWEKNQWQEGNKCRAWFTHHDLCDCPILLPRQSSVLMLPSSGFHRRHPMRRRRSWLPPV